MKKRWLSIFVLVVCFIACSSINYEENSDSLADATPLPLYQSSQITRPDFFTEIIDYPQIDEVTDYCNVLINNHENDWNSLTDAFESVFEEEERPCYFSIKYEQYYNYGQSYLFMEGLENNHLLHEPITDQSSLGKAFYSYLVNFGEIPFSSVYNFSGRASLIGYAIEAYFPEISKSVPVWFVRGNRSDALAIDGGFLSGPICWKITIIPINDDWFVYYRYIDE